MKTPREFMLAMRDKSEATYVLMLVALYLVGFVSGVLALR